MGCFLFGIRQRPTLPGRLQPSTIGAERLNFCVRYGNRWIPFAIVTGILLGSVQSAFFLVSAASICNHSFLLGEPPHSLRFFHYSGLVRQTADSLPAWSDVAAGTARTRTLKTAHPEFFHLAKNQSLLSIFPLVSLDSQISLDQVLDRLVSASFYVTAFTPLTYHLVVFQGSYFFRMGYLFLRWASRLDAFSVYPVRISLPSCALGRTTVAPVMRPLRSSRTRSSSSHVSFAHDG